MIGFFHLDIREEHSVETHVPALYYERISLMLEMVFHTVALHTAYN